MAWLLAVVRRRDRHRRAPGGANVDGLQAVAPHPPGQVAHEGARRVANRGGAQLQHGGEEGVRRTRPRSCSSHCSASSADLGAGARASNSSARRRAVRRWTGMAKRRSISRLGVRWRSSISTHHHGVRSPSVRDRLNLPQPHSRADAPASAVPGNQVLDTDDLQKGRNPYSRPARARCSCRVSDRTAVVGGEVPVHSSWRPRRPAERTRPEPAGGPGSGARIAAARSPDYSLNSHFFCPERISKPLCQC